ncbi:DUF934 domain-containing protein [Cohaesibacter sp. CAU 1516]|uniref:DUF934 domain-containing protein n=1 Tax=Cohaesibacter sp. CAU 1516 TaxID=2576038 RepID=UPI001AEE2CCD|nr:DUF934 domain-containing protein [Cohaesibacter sp. CAU 1516]
MTAKNNQHRAPLYKDRAFHENKWQMLEGDQSPVDVDRPILTFAEAIRLLELRANLPQCFGVCVEPGDDVEALAPYLDGIALIAISFPAFSDGRGFSSARLLKERYGYKGEIRAVGHFILDQMPFLERCGVDSFLITSDKVRAGLERGEWPEVTNYYQPTAHEGDAPIASRTWLRQRRS